MEHNGKERVLLVDDEPQVLVALEDALSDEFSVIKTNSAEAALQTMQREQDIAVIVTDQRMPLMTGDELLARMAESDATRILLTGYADLSAVIRAINEGKIFAYVSKPWNADDLRLKVIKAAEHFRLARQLASERKLLNSVLESMGEGVVVADKTGKFLVFNRHAEEILGKTAHDVPLEAWAETFGLFTPDKTSLLASEENPLVRAMQGESVARAELCVRRASTADKTVRITATPLLDERNSVRGGIAVLHDVTHQRRLEQQFQHVQKMEAIGRLAGGIAHDFNNILAVISSYASVVVQGMGEDDPHVGDLREILAASQRAASLTGQLLAFSRRRMAQPRVLDLNEVVASVDKMLRRVIGEDVGLQTTLATELGLVKADAGQIEQVLLNLAVNARDAMPQGGTLTIQTRNIGQGDAPPPPHSDGAGGPYVALVVSDTGIGMDVETQRHLFEPFFTTKEVGRGTGLGLSTVYGIIQQAGGHILVHSEIGRGTRFEILLPRVDGSAESTRPARVSEDTDARGGTILLVEDDEALRHITGRILRRRGYEVHEARSAAEAEALFDVAPHRVDLLLTDVVMPGMSGPDLAQRLLERDPRVRVLYMSGYSGGALMQQDALRPDMAYLDKPFTPVQLIEKVREVLGRAGTSAPRLTAVPGGTGGGSPPSSA
jgi:PAS domain S-box-containing protein